MKIKDDGAFTPKEYVTIGLKLGVVFVIILNILLALGAR